MLLRDTTHIESTPGRALRQAVGTRYAGAALAVTASVGAYSVTLLQLRKFLVKIVGEGKQQQPRGAAAAPRGPI